MDGGKMSKSTPSCLEGSKLAQSHYIPLVVLKYHWPYGVVENQKRQIGGLAVKN